MKLQTEILLKPEKNQIDYDSKVLLMGSCFTENIGSKFDYFKFQNLQNPFGVIFNPVSLEKLVVRALDQTSFSEVDIFRHEGLWKCFDVHSSLVSLDRDEFLSTLNHNLSELREWLLTASHIVFTYGTAWVYRHIKKDIEVANCHKIPQGNFEKRLLSVPEVGQSIQNIFERISKENPKATIINTISPVRHTKDGFVGNSRSKAHLIAALHEKLNRVYKLIDGRPYYFPSYEIVMDELRDYRFYAEDLLHPNKIGIEIIWNKFSVVWISPETESLQKKIDSIQKSLAHRTFNSESNAHVIFQKKLQQQIESVQKENPHISFD